VTGQRLSKVQAHHVAVIGMSSARNDYYVVPLSWEYHVGNIAHITEQKLINYCGGEDLRDLCLFYVSLYIEWKAGRYDIDADEVMNFVELRRRKEGII
jgi:hypothetical protein